VGPAREDLCYATSNRQRAVKELAQRTSLVLVVGSANSSNSQRLVETARTSGADSFLIEDETAIDPAWLEGVDTVGVTAGASAPERLVQRVCAWLCESNAAEVEELVTSRETVTFAQPHELRHAKPLGDVKPAATSA
jgi:4-hydroxy-3-methylbut-2-enyl diphosphate reductase